jgi:nitrite reductase/ring-hydroxylating ferredoxin subunit
MSFTTALIRRIEAFEGADRVAKPLQRFASRLVQPRVVRNTLSGTTLGHPLHPMLTDVPIGAWLAAALLDTVGGATAGPAADLLVGAGVAAAVPTALSGLNDWSDTYGPETRLGFAHAAGNVVAVGLYAASLGTRLVGNRAAGRVLGFAGLATMTTGAYLGGHLSFVRGVNVNRTAYEERPTDWTDVAADTDVGDGAMLKVTAGGAGVFLHRRGGRLYALANTCSHMGGPLDEGRVGDGCVTCPWHGSVFRLDDGSIVRGPASTPQPTYETRVVSGRVQVRTRS